MGGIIPVKTIEEIENYIEEQDQNGALLVTGARTQHIGLIILWKS